MRAVSSAIDAALFCLFVSAAVGTLALSPTHPQPPSPDERAHVLATSTTTLSVASPAGTTRNVHGSLAGLLARSATGRVTVEGHSLAPEWEFAEAARTAVTQNVGRRTTVRAVWSPYPAAPVGGVATAGAPPPRDATVATATLSVPSDTTIARPRVERAAADGGFRGVARVAAEAVVELTFPPRETQLAVGDSITADALTRRYRRAGDAVGVDVDSTDVAAANAALTRALTDRFADDLRRRYDSPTAAADALRVGEVTVVVRTWSR